MEEGDVRVLSEEIKLRRLTNQHLLAQVTHLTVSRDLCGIQAQFLSNAFHALTIRSNDFSADQPTGLVKSWTLRGTMHLFDETDLPLMLHRGRTHFLRPCDTLAADEHISEERKSFFANMIVRSVREGVGERETLKQVCFEAGMTETEAQSVFNPWGGLIRALCESGAIAHAVREKKAFVPCPPFEPMEREAAQLELARRYFTHYGPATVRDAAYFFACTQAEVKNWLKWLPVKAAECEGKNYYYIEESVPETAEIPACVFLAGFDPLMMGYEKTENPFLPKEHLREIFSLAGIVSPALLVHGNVAGRWKRTGKKLTITLFEPVAAQDITQIRDTAYRIWPMLSKIEGI